MNTADFDYTLPGELIAQQPARRRDSARMMVVDRASGAILHGRVADLPGTLVSGDLLVLNDTRVIPARLTGRKSGSGGRAEVLLLEEAGASGDARKGAGAKAAEWRAFAKMTGRTKPGIRLDLCNGRLRAEIVACEGDGHVRVRLEGDTPVMGLVNRHGSTPLPPYIRRPRGAAEAPCDRRRYQTVYARCAGAVAAPTAGLHFSRALLDRLGRRGIGATYVTLHVGAGTFRPVKTGRIEDHVMESERFSIPAKAAADIMAARRTGGRVVAIGTTVVRALETVAREHGQVVPFEGRTDLFVHPPDRVASVDALLTNFHLPRSTLLMLVCSFAGRDLVMRAYSEAVRMEYRFYSYGDCMLVL